MVGNFHYHKLEGTLESKVPSQLWFLVMLWWCFLSCPHINTTNVFYPNVRFVFISIDSIYDISLPSTHVPSLLTPNDSRQMQILDRTGMLRALELTADGLIKLYAVVETGLINDLDIGVVKVSTCRV